jgi:hypothetical protein
MIALPAWGATDRTGVRNRANDSTTAPRTQTQTATQTKSVQSRAAIVNAPATRKTSVAARAAATQATQKNTAARGQPAPSSTARSAVDATPPRRGMAAGGNALPEKSGRPAPVQLQRTIVARAAADDAVATTASTKTGAAYEKCKNAYYACMDQFCAQKNEKYRRCSCSDKIYELDEQQKLLESAAEKINEFNSGLDAVGLTAKQAAAMRNATEGETAMGDDKSASKRLLAAIMNSISGAGETKVAGGSLEKLNSVSFNQDAFGANDNGQLIASYNGEALYKSIYGQCRNVVRSSCTDDGLQRAVTAYLMSVENDCGTVGKMITENRAKMNAAVKESEAMLGLARVENRQNHNSASATECLNAVETAIKDPQVCGPDYNKCLDNGEFIDKDTGRPFAGVANFYELAELLAFDSGIAIADQKLALIPANRQFVQNFTSRNKKFAEPALDKCVEISAQVWSDYLDKAMLEIHYAQAAKVDEIKRGCFDFVRECYVDGKKSVTDFMKDITDVSGAALQPETIALTGQLCESYVKSCDKLFGENIVSEYIAQIDSKDISTTCRNVVKECFDSYGGAGYNNFYNPASGLFKAGQAFDWFALYADEDKSKVLSPCARQLKSIANCAGSPEQLEKIFGGTDKMTGTEGGKPVFEYGTLKKNLPGSGSPISEYLNLNNFRETGVATEVYNIIIGKLTTDCLNYSGSFIEWRYISPINYCTRRSIASNSICGGLTPCQSIIGTSNSSYSEIATDYGVTDQVQNMCPNGYDRSIDTQSWGICSCWQNGGRQPDNRTNGQPGCYAASADGSNQRAINDEDQACPIGSALNTDNKCTCPGSVSNPGNCYGTPTPNLYDMTKVPRGGGG